MKNIKERLGKELLFFDGGYGTLFQQRGLPAGMRPEIWNITHPDVVLRTHREYVEAGADILKTNTFGANRFRFDGKDGYTLEETVKSAAAIARKAIGDKGYVALDIGPCGKLVGTDLGFEEAVSVFADTVKAGAGYCDLVLLETFGNLTELRAAILAVKENCRLPFICTFVCDESGRTFTGSPASVIAKVCEAMGASAVGLNCGVGPVAMVNILPEIVSSVGIPVVINPNAGLPELRDDGSSYYSLTPESFAGTMKKALLGGTSVLGGCCGTTPAHISALHASCKGQELNVIAPVRHCEALSSTLSASVDEENVCIIGERINPTGKPKLKEALRAGDIDYILGEAINQKNAGADILDVNCGLADIDEADMLEKSVAALQKCVNLPLQIDTADPLAMEKALRLYDGLALINSVNGSEKSLSSVLPLAAKYGGTVIGLALDEKGIPDTPEGRFEIAERIVNRAAEFGIEKHRIIIDPLALTLGADPAAADKTLAAVKMIKEKLGVRTSLGVSNISFGMPDREKINCDFLAAAKKSGLDAAIMNPLCEPMMLIAKGLSADDGIAADKLREAAQAAKNVAADTETLDGCIYGGLGKRASDIAEKLCADRNPMEIISSLVVPALDRVGRDFEKGSIFLPGLLASADAAVAALDLISSHIPAGSEKSGGKVVLATVEGDVHDIGKNILAVLLRSYGFEVIDLGKNVPAAAVLDAVKQSGAKVVGLSALMTTTLPSMAKTVALLKSEIPDIKISVGGAVLNAEYAEKIGADNYSPEATETVRFAGEIYG